MKKLACILFLLFTCISSPLVSSVHALDSSLNGSWGISMDGEKLEIIRFNSVNSEIIIMSTLLRANDYSVADDTIHIYNFDGDSVIIQYYRLAPEKLLFILWNTNNITESITLILSKL